MNYDPIDLGSLTMIQITKEEHTPRINLLVFYRECWFDCKLCLLNLDKQFITSLNRYKYLNNLESNTRCKSH